MAKPIAIKLQRDIDELLAPPRKPLAIAGKRSNAISAFYFLRPLADGDEPLMFLFHAAKRSMAKSHDRNKQKRRMREAVRTLPIYDDVHNRLKSASLQALVLVRTTKPPSKDGSWRTVLSDMEIIGVHLRKAISKHA